MQSGRAHYINDATINPTGSATTVMFRAVPHTFYTVFCWYTPEQQL